MCQDYSQWFFFTIFNVTFHGLPMSTTPSLWPPWFNISQTQSFEAPTVSISPRPPVDLATVCFSTNPLDRSQHSLIFILVARSHVLWVLQYEFFLEHLKLNPWFQIQVYYPSLPLASYILPYTLNPWNRFINETSEVATFEPIGWWVLAMLDRFGIDLETTCRNAASLGI